jgi:Flp pilus assembly protein TadB
MSTPSVRARIAGSGPHLRAADADREQIADQLRTSHTEGRLDLNEFQQRLDRCYEAKTFGELGALVSDLPGQEEPRERHPGRRRGPRPHVLLPVIALLFIVMAASSAAWHHGHHPFFLIVPIVFLIWRMTSMRRARWSTAGRGPGGPASSGGPGRWA